MASRKITANRRKPVRAPAPSKTHERELARVAEFMVVQMSRTFRKQVLDGLSADAVDTFEDAEPVNFAAQYRKLAERTTKKLIAQFDNSKIQSLVSKILNKVNDQNRSQLYGAVEKAIGLSSKELTNTEGLREQIDAYIAETAQWVEKLRDDTLAEYTANSLRAMTLGQSIEEVMEQYEGMVEKRKNHAKFVARNQIANFNSITTKARAQNLGITQARWITSKDERTRPSHKDRDGKVFDLDKGLYSEKDGKRLLPGVDYQCRCTYELIIPEA